MRKVYNRVYDPETWEKVNPESKELLDDFILDMKARRLKPTTINQYYMDLRGFLCYLFNVYNNRFVLELTKKDLKRYALELVEERQVSNSRRNVLMASLKSMLNYAEDDDDWKYEINASRMIKSLHKMPIKPILFLDDSVVMGLYDELMQRAWYQHAAILMLAYESAGRRAELAQVHKYTFLDPTLNNTNQVVGKGGKKFSLIYFEPTRRAALAWLEQRGEDGIDDLFTAGDGLARHEADPMDVYRLFLDMRGIDFLPGDEELDFGPHTMRHSALTNYKTGTHHVCRDLGISGFSLDQLQILAHHSDISTTQGYLPDRTKEELESMFSIAIQ